MSGTLSPPICAEERQVVMRDRGGVPCAYGWSAQGAYWLEFPGVATFCFRPEAREVAFAAEAGIQRSGIVETYCTAVLPLVYQIIGFEALHASAVRMNDGVVGLCALSETGKSTLAYGLSRRSHDLWTDDVLIVDIAAPGVYCHPVPYTVHMRPDMQRHFGLRTDEGEGLAGDGSGEPAPLGALLLIERGDPRGPSSWRRLPLSEALQALLPHAFRFTLSELDRKRNTMQSYLDLAARVPVIRFRFAPGFDKLNATLDGIEAAVAEARA
jgi:hypothetical protein